MSFWLHIDSAWGGYISSLFHFDEEERINMKMNKIYQKLSGIELPESIRAKEKMNLIIAELRKNIHA